MDGATVTSPRRGAALRARLKAVPGPTWLGVVGIAALIVAAVVWYLEFPAYPTYDALYSLIWGKELTALERPSFDGYRAPTEHPLAVLMGAGFSRLGDAAEDVLLIVNMAFFVVLVIGVYRLGRVCFSRLVGWIAALLLCARLDFSFLALRGFSDIPYLAFLIWAAALEARHPRRGGPVWVLLALAGLLRPDAWLLAGVYVIWMGWSATWAQRARYVAWAAAAPVLWLAFEWIATGDPLFSLTKTSGQVGELGRNRTLLEAPGEMLSFLARLDTAPILIVAVVGIALAIAVARRRAIVPLVLLGAGVLTFLAITAAGLAVIDRYVFFMAVVLVVFAAVALGGFTLLPSESRWRRPWAAALALVPVALVFAVLASDTQTFNDEVNSRVRVRERLEELFATPNVKAAIECGKTISVPNHKMIPEIRWLTGKPAERVVARSDPDARKRYADRGMAIFIVGRRFLENNTYGAFVEKADSALIQVPPPGYTRVTTGYYFSTYWKCPENQTG